jgi:hypothetical protein
LDKKSVTVINPIQAVQAMEKLYMVVEIRWLNKGGNIKCLWMGKIVLVAH